MTVTPSKIGSIRVIHGKATSITVWTAPANPLWPEQDGEAASASGPGLLDGESARVDINATKVNSHIDAFNRDSIEDSNADMDLPSWSRKNTADIHTDLGSPTKRTKHTFLSFSIARYEYEPGPVFNYASLWTHRFVVSHVIDGFQKLNSKLKADSLRTVHGRPRDPHHWERNF